MAFLSPIEFNVGLLSALNLSLPTNQAKLKQIHAKAAVKQQILVELSQILAKKALQPFGKAADAAAFFPGLGLEAPRGLSPPDELTPAPGLAPPLGLACPNRSKPGECRKKDVSGIDDYIDSGTLDTSVGAGSTTFFASEGIEPEPEEFQMGADVCCFVTSSLNNNPCKALSPREATGMALPPVWVCADQVQQGGHCWPQETQLDQQLLKQINEQQQQKQQRLLEQRRRIIPMGGGAMRKL